MRDLPTQREMFTNARTAIQQAKKLLADAQLEAKGDWHPVGSSLTDAGADARIAVLRMTREWDKAYEVHIREFRR